MAKAKKLLYVCPLCGTDMKARENNSIQDLYCSECNEYWTPRNLIMSYSKRLKLIESAIGKHTYGGAE